MEKKERGINLIKYGYYFTVMVSLLEGVCTFQQHGMLRFLPTTGSLPPEAILFMVDVLLMYVLMS